MNHISYGEIFLDTSNRLVDFNPSVQKLPGLPGKIEICQSASHALGVWWEQISPMIGLDEISKEVIQQTDSGERLFRIKSNPLVQPGGSRVGQVFVFEDITHLRDMQKLQIRQVYMQASLEEREQLAGELHDRLSQTLAYISLQARAAQLHLEHGMNQAAQECLSRLIANAEDVQEETRALIGSLLSVSSSVENFWEAILHLLEKFRQETGLQAHFEVQNQDAGDSLASDTIRVPALAGMQMFRIVQEALTNARKHARGMSQVWVRIAADRDRMVLTIEDDGEGFEPALMQGNGQHFGLKIMTQRAQRAGGQIVIHSTPGKGTRIEVCLPLAGN